MSSTVFFILVFLQLKHWYVDFVLQTDAQVKGKGIYGNIDGLKHSLQHGVFTTLVFSQFSAHYLIIGLVDFVLHYHIDWIKVNYGNQDITCKKFWVDLGADQTMHQLCYLIYILVII